MDKIIEIASKNGLFVIEDAAQALLSTYKGKFLGTICDIGCLSFHETKNVISGEGGAILINQKLRPDLARKAEIVWEKGTNWKAFDEGSTLSPHRRIRFKWTFVLPFGFQHQGTE